MALHMNGGQGDTSYVKNSELQKTNYILEEAVGVLCSTVTSKTMKIADLGCSSGPNTLLSVTMILDAIQHNCSHAGHQTPEFQVFLNDLPENDFNTLFKIISTSPEKLRGETGGDSRSCFVSGCPGSFYGRLFPTESMHFFYSSSSLHWLSKGIVEEAKLDSFNMPFFEPHLEDVRKVIEEGPLTSFILNHYIHMPAQL